VLKGMTGIESIVPNETLVGSVVQNETFTDPKVRIALPIQVSYATDLEKAMAIMVEAAQAARVMTTRPRRLPRGLCRQRHQPAARLLDPRPGRRHPRHPLGDQPGDLAALQGGGHRDPLPQREVRILNPARRCR
jgi:hypothetical protein